MKMYVLCIDNCKVHGTEWPVFCSTRLELVKEKKEKLDDWVKKVFSDYFNKFFEYKEVFSRERFFRYLVDNPCPVDFTCPNLYSIEYPPVPEDIRKFRCSIYHVDFEE